MGGGKKKRVKDLEALKEKVKKKVEKPVKIEKPKLEARAIVRVAGTDLDGEKPIIRAIKGIKGISHTMAKAICVASGFDFNRKIGSLNESEIKKLEEVIKEPIKFGVPSFLFNRRKDVETGKEIHLTGPDLDMIRKFDIKKHVDLKTYKGWRHMLGQPVRGQRTRSKFRERGRIVGVLKKAIKLQLREKEEKEEKK